MEDSPAAEEGKNEGESCTWNGKLSQQCQKGALWWVLWALSPLLCVPGCSLPLCCLPPPFFPQRCNFFNFGSLVSLSQSCSEWSLFLYLPYNSCFFLTLLSLWLPGSILEFLPLCPGACWCLSHLCVSLCSGLSLFKVFLLGSVAWSESVSFSISLCSAPCPSLSSLLSVLWPAGMRPSSVLLFLVPVPYLSITSFSIISLWCWITVFNSSFSSLRPIILSPAYLRLPAPILIPHSLAGAVLPVQMVWCQVFIPTF